MSVAPLENCPDVEDCLADPSEIGRICTFAPLCGTCAVYRVIEGRRGLHIFEDHFIPEIINPETGEVLPYGEKGELVFTTITKEAFPLIRYRRDRGGASPNSRARSTRDRRARRRDSGTRR